MIFSLAKLELNVLNIMKMICEKHFHVILVFDSFVYAKTMCHMFFFPVCLHVTHFLEEYLTGIGIWVSPILCQVRVASFRAIALFGVLFFAWAVFAVALCFVEKCILWQYFIFEQKNKLTR